MRPISRTALGVATAAVLAVTAVAPSVARPQDDTTGKRPLVGSEAAEKAGAAGGKGDKPVTVTLLAGDKVLVSRDGSGAAAAVALPREDGTVPLVQTRQSGEDLYVYPQSAAKALSAGQADQELFNVTGLIRQGYDDAHAKSLPLIAVYGSDVARSAPVTPRGAERGLVLKPVDGLAPKADKKKAADFWQDITSPRSRAASGLKKLWLDRKVEANLERSTRQVGADLARAAGYDGKGTKVAVLDTGADAGHPDLKDRITAAENFTDSPDTGDRRGHGTHTLSTVGGSGAASDGKKKGVAPGADLLNGKVLGDGGSGAASWIIAGMQWAVDQKADVVSMSLGTSAPTDCTDPMSVPAEQLAQSKGTLFVRDGESLGRSPYPFGVFDVPAEEGAYGLTLDTTKAGQPAAVWKRSTRTRTTWAFRSRLDESAYSQGIPLPFPGHDLPEDGMKTLPARDGQRMGLGVSGHAGYTPGALTDAKLSYSYDDGETWTAAKTAQRSGSWTATVNHAGAAGKPVTLKTELTDAKGNSVTQVVARAYDVR